MAASNLQNRAFAASRTPTRRTDAHHGWGDRGHVVVFAVLMGTKKTQLAEPGRLLEWDCMGVGGMHRP